MYAIITAKESTVSKFSHFCENFNILIFQYLYNNT